MHNQTLAHRPAESENHSPELPRVQWLQHARHTSPTKDAKTSSISHTRRYQSKYGQTEGTWPIIIRNIKIQHQMRESATVILIFYISSSKSYQKCVLWVHSVILCENLIHQSHYQVSAKLLHSRLAISTHIQLAIETRWCFVSSPMCIHMEDM